MFSVKIFIFYVIFYICLAAFWALMLLIFHQTIDHRVPKWQLGESRIGTNPGNWLVWLVIEIGIFYKFFYKFFIYKYAFLISGLGFRPRPDSEHIESTLIWFKPGAGKQNWQHWKENLDQFMKRLLYLMNWILYN